MVKNRAHFILTKARAGKHLTTVLTNFYSLKLLTTVYTAGVNWPVAAVIK